MSSSSNNCSNYTSPLSIFLTLCYLSFFASLVPDDQSLKVYRAEANWGLMRFSDALTDLDYLCCLRPNWTEVRDIFSVGQTYYILFLWLLFQQK